AFDALAEIDRLATAQAQEYKATLSRTGAAAYFGSLAVFERQVAEELWYRLRPLSPEERRFQVEEDIAFHRWGVAERLAHETISVVADDDKSALALAHLAKSVAERVQGDEGFRCRIQGYAGAFVANVVRVGGRLPAA